MDYVSSPQLPIPSAADSVSVTSSASAWANSSWVELAASLGFDGFLSGISAITTDQNNIHFEVDIGVGGAGSEVVIATIKGRTSTVLANLGEDLLFPLPILIDALTAGSRVAARIRTSATSAITWAIGAAYYTKPIDGVVTSTTKPIKVLPSAANLTTVTSGGSWTSGAWVQMTAALAADSVLVGIVASGGQEWEMDIGTGGAGSEVVKTTHRGMGTNTEPSRHFQTMIPIPIDAFASGARVAARCRFTGVSPRSMRIGIMYVEKPL